MRIRVRLIESKEDIQRFIDKFGKENYDKFIKLKDRFKNKNIPIDIVWHTKYTSKEDMNQLIYDFDKKVVKDETGKVRNNAKLIAENEHYKVYDILDWQTAMNMGNDTEWCISGRYDTYGGVKPSQAEYYFNDYKENIGVDKFLFYMPKHNEKKYCLQIYKNENYSYDGKYVFWDSDDNFTKEIPEYSPEFSYAGIDIIPYKIIDLKLEELDVQDIFLLSTEEYRKYKKLIPKLHWWWWLRSPGYFSDLAAYVRGDNIINDLGTNVDISDVAVRPALRISNFLSSDVDPGDIVEIFDRDWIVLDKNLVIAKKLIGQHRFDEKSNDYETSEIKKYLHKWLEEQKERYL